MARKVILDVDPGTADAVAMCVALSDPRLDVIAVTATAGNVGAAQATRNVQTIIERLDPPRWPRVGTAMTTGGLLADRRDIFGSDGLGDVDFRVSELQHRHPSDKLICDEIHAAPEEVTILALGPLTNIAAALQRDPDLAMMVGHLIIVGGTVTAAGNVTAAAEFNIFCAPEAARIVFRTPITKTLVPLDVTRRVVMTYEHLSQFSGTTTKTGKLLEKILPPTFHNHRQHLALEGMYVDDAVGIVAATDPHLFRTRPLYGDVETAGELTLGSTVFDRRSLSDQPPNMDVAIDIDAAQVIERIMSRLAAAD